MISGPHVGFLNFECWKSRFSLKSILTFRDNLSCSKISTIVKFSKCTGTFKLQKVSYVLLRAKEKCSVHTFLSEIFCRSAARLQDQCKMHAFCLDDATFVPH